jgi:hypothetical protein
MFGTVLLRWCVSELSWSVFFGSFRMQKLITCAAVATLLPRREVGGHASGQIRGGFDPNQRVVGESLRRGHCRRRRMHVWVRGRCGRYSRCLSRLQPAERGRSGVDARRRRVSQPPRHGSSQGQLQVARTSRSCDSRESCGEILRLVNLK